MRAVACGNFVNVHGCGQNRRMFGRDPPVQQLIQRRRRIRGGRFCAKIIDQKQIAFGAAFEFCIGVFASGKAVVFKLLGQCKCGFIDD